MKKWENKIIFWNQQIDDDSKGSLENTLNEMGNEGWEVVSVEGQILSLTNPEQICERVETRSLAIFLKREVL